jgi:glycosyltransferase involved in cell wall biosynthesis
LNFFTDNANKIGVNYLKSNFLYRIFGFPKTVNAIHINLCGTAIIDKNLLIKIKKYINAGGGLYTTLHNKIPEDKVNLYTEFLLLSKKILVHCENDSISELSPLKNYENFKNNIVFVEHPNYIDYISYSKCDYRKKFEFKDDDIVFMFHGLIEKRKNIEHIIKVFNEIKKPNIKLLIVGKCSNLFYRIKLLSVVKTPNIRIIFKFIDDKNFNAWFNTSDIQIYAPNLNHQLNSASIFYSLSNKKTFVCPKIGSVNSISDTTFTFGFDCKNNAEKIQLLSEKIFEISNNYSRKDLELFGLKGYEYVKVNNSMANFISKIKEFYS